MAQSKFLSTAPIGARNTRRDRDFEDAFGLGNKRISVARDFIRSSLTPSNSPLANLLAGITGGLHLTAASADAKAAGQRADFFKTRIDERAQRASDRLISKFDKAERKQKRSDDLTTRFLNATTDEEKAGIAAEAAANKGDFVRALQIGQFGKEQGEATDSDSLGSLYTSPKRFNLGGTKRSKKRGGSSVFGITSEGRTDRFGRLEGTVKKLDVLEESSKGVTGNGYRELISRMGPRDKLTVTEKALQLRAGRMTRLKTPPRVKNAKFGDPYLSKGGIQMAVIDKETAIPKAAFDDMMANDPAFAKAQNNIKKGDNLPDHFETTTVGIQKLQESIETAKQEVSQKNTELALEAAKDALGLEEVLGAEGGVGALEEGQRIAGLVAQVVAEVQTPDAPVDEKQMKQIAERIVEREREVAEADVAGFREFHEQTQEFAKANPLQGPDPVSTDAVTTTPVTTDEMDEDFSLFAPAQGVGQAVADAVGVQAAPQAAPELPAPTDRVPLSDNRAIVDQFSSFLQGREREAADNQRALVSEQAEAREEALRRLTPTDDAGMDRTNFIPSKEQVSGASPDAAAISTVAVQRQAAESARQARLTATLEAQKGLITQSQQAGSSPADKAGADVARDTRVEAVTGDVGAQADEAGISDRLRAVLGLSKEGRVGGNTFGGNRFGGRDEVDEARRTTEGRQIITGPDGRDFSEISITVTDPRLNDGKPTNIPSVFGGIEVSEDQAVRIMTKNNGFDPETGIKARSFDSIREAEFFAQVRSNSIREAK